MRNHLLVVVGGVLTLILIFAVIKSVPYMFLDNTQVKTLHAHKVDILLSLSETELRDIIENYDLLITGSQKECANLSDLNPELKIFIYHSISTIREDSEYIKTARANGWILKDSSGNEVYYTFISGIKMYYIDVGNPEFRMWWAEVVNERIKDTHISGVFGDVTRSNFVQPSSTPIDPRTGKAYSNQQYAMDMALLVKKIKETTGKIYISNGYGLLCGSHSSGYYQNKKYADLILAEVDGICLEGFIRFRDDEYWRPAEDWEKDLKFLDFLNKKGKMTLAWTLTTGSLPKEATQDKIALYGYATYLLARRGGNAYFTARDYEDEFLRISKIELGHPVDEYHIRNDVPVFERTFDKALVLVNPNDVPYVISLDGTYKTLDNMPISKISLEPHTGLILKNEILSFTRDKI